MRVVTAAMIERDGKFLLCQRPFDKNQGGKWEFPGGKLEEGETLEECLARELREELAIEARAVRVFDARVSGEFIIIYYIAEIVSGQPRALEHNDIRWVCPRDFHEYVFPEGDAVVARKMVDMLQNEA